MHTIDSTLNSLRIKLFCDGADMDGIRAMYRTAWIRGFTTNPTLMRKAGVLNYEAFGRKLLAEIPDRPVALEVFSDDLQGMEAQARKISSWGANVNVKIPVTNTKGFFTGSVISNLSADGVVVNVTAITTLEQVQCVVKALDRDTPAIVSIFAGRVADTGIDPVPLMEAALEELSGHPKTELLWASPREVLNIFQAEAAGVHIITATQDILNKLGIVGKNLTEYSLDTVKMFYKDAMAAGFSV